MAVLDVDYHHGNGTQTIFYGRDDVLTVSLHGDPRTEYPFFLGHADERGEGAGLGANLNPAAAARYVGRDLVRGARGRPARCVVAHRAEALVVALGVDTFEGATRSRASTCAPTTTCAWASAWRAPAGGADDGGRLRGRRGQRQWSMCSKASWRLPAAKGECLTSRRPACNPMLLQACRAELIVNEGLPACFLSV